MLDKCKFRIGTEEYKKKYKTYGATTLNTSHLLFRRNDNNEKEVEIKFRGKKSVINTNIIKRPHKRDSINIIPPELLDSLLVFPKKANTTTC